MKPTGSGKDRLTPENWLAFQKRLRAYVGKRAQAGDVDDIVGEILLKLVRTQASLEIARDPAAWVMRVAANAIADHHRKRSVERTRLAQVEQEMALTLASAREPQDNADAEIARCLVPFIKGLPAVYAETLMIVEVDGMTQAEAAERLALSLPAVKSRVQRGRAKLKEALLRCCALQLDRRGNVMDYRLNGSSCGDRC